MAGLQQNSYNCLSHSVDIYGALYLLYNPVLSTLKGGGKIKMIVLEVQLPLTFIKCQVSHYVTKCHQAKEGHQMCQQSVTYYLNGPFYRWPKFTALIREKERSFWDCDKKVPFEKENRIFACGHFNLIWKISCFVKLVSFWYKISCCVLTWYEISYCVLTRYKISCCVLTW